jgi:outer membrane protein assembly factor BamB
MKLTRAPNRPSRRPPIRLWPGVSLVVLQWLLWLVLPMAVPGALTVGALAGILGGLAILSWWLFFSRTPWVERIGAVALAAGAIFAVSRLAHASIATGMMGFLPVYYGIPALSLALVAWAAATRGLADGPRRAWLVVAMLLAGGVFVVLRTGGVAGGLASDFHWRWTPSAEERLLSGAADQPVVRPSAPAPAEVPGDRIAPQPDMARAAGQAAPTDVASPKEPAGERLAGGPSAKAPTPPESAEATAWTGFRGPDRDGLVPHARIDTDWSQHPPVLLWRRPIGPGWSSFAVSGDFLYTQEQRGDDEIVACYRVSTGEPVWRHRDATRFWESNGGAGPRATPALGLGRVYALGATGLLNALDAGSGAVAWSRDVASDTGTQVPTWGFAGSPLIVGDDVVVAAAGRLAAYGAATGERRWLGPARGGSYSSPHRATLGGTPQILLMTDAGAVSVSPADGSLLWEYPWEGAAIVQPAVTPEGDVLLSTAEAPGGQGIRRLAIARGAGGWSVDVRWRSTGLKPYFNDMVVDDGHAYGFDGSILACIDLADGRRTWKGGRYGYGQMLLVGQGVLLVLSEEGELALVAARPDQFRELARFPAIDGKTWNHPVLVGDVLLVRNGEEMAAFRLPRAGR